MRTLSKPFISLFIINLFASTLVSAVDKSNSYGFKKMATSLCEYAKANESTKMRSILRKANTHIRSIYPEVQCDGQSLMSTATKNRSDKVISYLRSKARQEVNMSNKMLASH